MVAMTNPVDRIRAAALEKAAPQLAEHAEAIRTLGKRVLSDVIEIGARLTKARELIAHGDWLHWLEAEFGWSDETARRFMSVFEMSKFHNLLDLDVPVSALYALARVPKESRDEIIAQFSDGERRSLSEVKAKIAVSRIVDVPAKSASPVYVRREPTAATVVRPKDIGFRIVDSDVQRLLDAIEDYGADLTDAKKSRLEKAVMEADRDRAAIRRCVNIIIAAIAEK
jgi:hypothetical protein